MDHEKKLAVIILNWNGLHLLQQFIPSLCEYTSGAEVDLFVADNGSTDTSVKWLKENFPHLKVIEFDKNYGFAEGYNRAISLTGYPFTTLLNSDVEVTPGWWKPILSFMEANPDVGALQPKIKSFRQKEYFEYAGAAGGYLDSLGYPYCRGRLFDRIEKDLGQYDGPPADVCWASGAALTVRTDLYLKLGGLDPLFFAHMEEIDLCCRMLAAGYRVCAISDSEVYHVGGASLKQGDPHKTYLNFRNNLLLLYKNLPEKGKSKKLFIRRLVDSLAFFRFLVALDFKNAGAILKAHKDFRKMKPLYSLLPSVPQNFRFPGSQRNILLDRYLYNKKK
ncbi:MAG: glycosyltransferase family 2 protein [Muribaculaceae bacterium]|nr:glycosyltransferase family 2 protein [Muribaculaceae bacterium]